MEYEPIMSKEELQSLGKENADEFYQRNHSVVDHFLKTHGMYHLIIQLCFAFKLINFF